MPANIAKGDERCYHFMNNAAALVGLTVRETHKKSLDLEQSELEEHLRALDHFELLMEIVNEFNVKFGEAVVGPFESMRHVAALQKVEYIWNLDRYTRVYLTYTHV